MFDFLKKKISGFVNKLTGREEKPEEKKTEAPLPSVPSAAPKPSPPAEKIEKVEKKKEVSAPISPPPEPRNEKTPSSQPEKMEAKKPEKSEREKISDEIPASKMRESKSEPPHLRAEAEKPKNFLPLERETLKYPEIMKREIVAGPVYVTPSSKPTAQSPRPLSPSPPAPASPLQPPISVTEKPREVKTGLFSAIKGLVTGEVEIAKGEVVPLLEEFELELLESDVAMEVAESVRQELYAKLVGAKVKRGKVSEFLQDTLRETLVALLTNKDQFDLLSRINQSSKPVKIMFLGPNGAGKTTTIAKVAHLLQQHGRSVVFAAGDTFRAAAIEQLGIHAGRLQVPIIQRPYGSDGTAVAYDAVGYAKAHGADVVLIDTAGRQDTNINLMNELKKMKRIIQPDITIYIGESIAGNALLEQVKAFHKELGVDGVILTKLDCDPKGGTMLSVSKATGLPIIYVGIGQGYGDFEVFDAEKIARRILS